MHLSLNEIDAQVRKAARGAGFEWGFAEEAGRAARWLLARGAPVLPAAADLLDLHAGAAGAASLTRRQGAFASAEGALSPLLLGPAIADAAYRIAAGETVAAVDVLHPVLLVPFCAAAARFVGAPIELSAASRRITMIAAGTERTALADLFGMARCGRVECTLAGRIPPDGIALPSFEGVEIDADLWSRFERLAALTYVPASALSRERGAGAGAIDNE